MEKVRFRAGDVILSEGEDGDRAYLIVSGSAEVIIGEGAKARRIATLKDGDVFGEMSLIEPGPRSATVRAVSDVECAATSYDDFMASMRENPEQAIEFMKVLVMRLRKMNEMMASLDPGKRGLMNVFQDWVASLDLAGEGMSEEDREQRVFAIMHSVPYF
jgi:CRP/FNR family cyclic AMP-dependent transcriptional regulator